MKSKTARDRKAKEEARANKGSQLKANASAQTIVCQICRTTFLCTSKPAALKQHAEGKHAKKTLKECFPNGEAEAA